MKKLIAIIFLASIFSQCDEVVCSLECQVPATVRDLTGLDGCGFVFELEDGSRLIPWWSIGYCGNGPVPDEVTNDPLYNFEFINGKEVLIGYMPAEGSTTCMSGENVRITCLTEKISVPE